MKEIPLTQGKVALVDDEDFEALNAVKWFAQRNWGTFYATRTVRPDGRHMTATMHRVVLTRKLGRSLVRGEHTDHIDGDGLNNRRANLRPATPAQNSHNCRRRTITPTSRYLGVCWHKSGGKWQAQIEIAGKMVYLGIYKNEGEAALAREFYIAAHPELQARSNLSQRELTL